MVPFRFRLSQLPCFVVMADIAAATLSFLVILAATADMLSRSIPDKLTLLITASFFPFAWASGMPLADLLIHFGVGIGLLVVAIIVFSLGLFGGGDGKLIAAAGLWIGPSGMADLLLGTAVTGGVLSLAFLVFAVPDWLFSQSKEGPASQRALPKVKVPYGYAIAAGTLLALPASWWSSSFPS